MKTPVAPLLILAAVLSGAPAAGDAPDGGAARERLRASYRGLAQRLAGDDAPLPFAVDTRGGSGDAKGDVYAVIEHDFAALSQALGVASNWCDIAPLHLNVKTCTFTQGEDGTLLTLYSGRKGYERPEDAHELRYEFRLAEARDDYFRVVLTADEGPLDTRDYALQLEATPVEDGATFVHLGYAYRYGFGTRLVLASYLATAGSGKVGFSIVDTDDRGDPVYVDGVAGLIERNSVRYQLAIQAYLDTLDAPAAQRFERRIARWYDLTDRFRRQLFEMDQDEYLRTKRREHSDQIRLQRELAARSLRH